MDKVVKYYFVKSDGTIMVLPVDRNRPTKEYENQLKDFKTCGYILEDPYEGKVYRFIKYRGGNVYDAFRVDEKAYVNMDWKFKKITDSTMTTYLKYLGVLENFKKFRGKKFLLSQIENEINDR